MNQRQEEILDAFVRIVARHGVNRTNMRDIAQEVGCSIGTIYNEFENKEALIDGLFERTQDEIDDLLKNLSIFCQASPEMRLRRFIIGYVRAVNIKMRQDRAFTELLKEANHFRHIGIKTMDFGKTVRGKVMGILADILRLGVCEGTFHVQNIPLTAQLMLDAFTVYLIPFLTIEREIDAVVNDAEEMLDLIIKSIKNK